MYLLTIFTVLAIVPFIAALPAENVKRAQTCKFEATATHSIGGGGPGQEPIDNVSNGSVKCYGGDGILVRASKERKADPFEGDSAEFTKFASGFTKGATMRTVYDSAANDFIRCEVTFGGKSHPAKSTNHISSGTVSVVTSRCTAYLPC